jgi:uncharacterized protein (DUF2141 family)
MTALALFALSLALQTQPPRDARPSGSGTASIRGRVLSDEPRPRPLRRARVTLRGGVVDFAENAITEDDGTFTLSRLPAGRYTLAVAKEGFVAMTYGARRPARPGTPIVLHERELKDLTVRLPPGGVITGLIIDAAGQPVQGVAVSALASTFHGATGERRLAPAGQAASTSDDRGEYRIYGLAVGEYVIAAQPLMDGPGPERPGAFEFRMSNARGRAVAPVPVYFPSTTDAGRAQPIAVGAGEERDGIDIRIENVPLATIGGVAAALPRAGPTNVTLTRSGDSSVEFVRAARADQTGQFVFASVPPGHYTVFAHAGGSAWGSADITVDGDDIPNLGIVMVPMLTISGRLVFEGGSDSPYPALLSVPLPVRPPFGRMTAPAPDLRLGVEGAFTISGLTAGTYGPFTQGLRTPIAGWWLKSAVVDGRDLLDGPLEVRTSIQDLVVTLSPRASEIAGTVRDPEARMTSGGFVVAFSTDRRSWFFNSRRAVGVRPDGAGRFSILNLPPGEYFVTAVADLSDGDWYDASVLEQLAARSERVAIAGTERKMIDLDRIQ